MTTTQRKIDDLVVSNFHLNDFTRLFKSFSPWIIRFAQAWSMNSIFAKPGESYETEKLSYQRGCWRCLFKRILLPNPSMHMTSCLKRNRYWYSRNPKFSKMSGSAHHNMKEVTTPLLTTSTAFQGVGRKEIFFFNNVSWEIGVSFYWYQLILKIVLSLKIEKIKRQIRSCRPSV